MFWQIGGAVDTTAPVRASAGSAPGRARAAYLGLMSCVKIRPRRVAHPPWRSRTAAGGTGVPPRRGSRSSPPPFPAAPSGPYQLQAAIAALHDEAQSPEATDWPEIAALYDVLLRLDDDPVVAPNHAVAISMVAGSRAGLELVQRLGTDPRVNADRRFYAVPGYLGCGCRGWRATGGMRLRTRRPRRRG
jgi:hypothetical protein